MFGGPEVWIVVVLILVLFGGSQLPKLARNLGRAQHELRQSLYTEQDSATTPITSAPPVSAEPSNDPPADPPRESESTGTPTLSQ